MTQTDSEAKPLASELQRTLERFEDSVKKRESAKVYQLSLWKDPQRAIPNEFVRSALFPAIQPKKAHYVERQRIFSQAGITITFTGKQLTQADLDVFEGIMHIARGMGEGNKVRFTAHQLLKLIGRHTGSSQYEWLLDVLERLTATSVGITRDDQKVFWSSLLPKGSADLIDGRFEVELTREMIQLFSRGYTLIEEGHHRRLSGKYLAKAIYRWISSHDKPYPVTVRFLHDLTGSENANLKSFRQKLKAALNDIKETGAIASWHIDPSDKVHIQKTPALPKTP